MLVRPAGLPLVDAMFVHVACAFAAEVNAIVAKPIVMIRLVGSVFFILFEVLSSIRNNE